MTARESFEVERDRAKRLLIESVMLARVETVMELITILEAAYQLGRSAALEEVMRMQAELDRLAVEQRV